MMPGSRCRIRQQACRTSSPASFRLRGPRTISRSSRRRPARQDRHPLATIGGIAQFSLVSGAQTGSVLVEVVADRADNNVGNGTPPRWATRCRLRWSRQQLRRRAAMHFEWHVAWGVGGQPYATILSASGGVPPYAWSLSSGSSLPGGLTLASDGITPGPTSGGTFRFIVRARDSAGTPAREVAGGCAHPSRWDNRLWWHAHGNGCRLAQGQCGCVLRLLPDCERRCRLDVWTSTTLPAGLALDSRTGFITGTPTAAGTFPVVLTVTDANGVQVNRNLSMVIDGLRVVALVWIPRHPLLFSIPASGSTDVDRCSDVVVRFNEAIDPVALT